MALPSDRVGVLEGAHLGWDSCVSPGPRRCWDEGFSTAFVESTLGALGVPGLFLQAPFLCFLPRSAFSLRGWGRTPPCTRPSELSFIVISGCIFTFCRGAPQRGRAGGGPACWSFPRDLHSLLRHTSRHSLTYFLSDTDALKALE